MADERSVQADPPSGGGKQGLGTKGAAFILLGILIVGGVIFGGLVYWNPPYLDGFASVVLLIAGFVTVTLMLLVGTVVLTALGMRAPTQALGMPEGSIRALIAMTLILIFAIIGVVVFNAGASTPTFSSTGLTQAQIDTLHAGGAIILRQTADVAVPGASEPLYTVLTRPSMTPDSHDFGLQLLTTVSTLVVAVAGFYFGSKATEQAITASRESRAPSAKAPAGAAAKKEEEKDEEKDKKGDA